jgi:predicted MFS family arabinose efflux permease
MVETTETESLLARIGIPPALAWGFAGLFLFMIGDGVESGYLSPYLMSKGVATANVAWLFTVYGVAVAIGGWLSGALSDVWGPRRVIVWLSGWSFKCYFSAWACQAITLSFYF